MKLLRYLVVCLIAAIINACGGGGGGGGGSTTNGGTNNSGDFSLSQNSVTINTKMQQQEPASISIKGTLKNAKSTVYLKVDASQTPLIKTAVVTVDSDSSGTLTLIPEASFKLKPGINTGVVTVRACKNDSCTSEYSGSPQTISISYSVTAPEFKISGDAVKFTMTEGADLPESIQLTMSSTEPVGYYGATQPADSQDWLHVGASWTLAGTEGWAAFRITKSLPVGIHTTLVNLFAHGDQVSKPVTVTLEVVAAKLDAAENKGVPVTGSIANQFAFTVNKLITDTHHNKIYLCDTFAKRVYQVDAATGLTTRYYEFGSLVRDITKSPNSDTLYILLEGLLNDKGKAVALDLNTERVVSSFSVGIGPQKAVVTSTGKLVVAELESLAVYDTSSGAKRGISDRVSLFNSITLLPSENYVFVGTGGSPSDISKFDIRGNGVVSLGDSPYHGEYYMEKVWALQNVDYIVTTGGDVFLSSTMTFAKDLFTDAVIIDLAYNSDKLVIFKASGKLITYDPVTFVEQSVVASNLEFPGFVGLINNVAYVVSMQNSGYKLQKFAL